MEYISVEQFLKADKRVQKSLLNWWKPEFGDLFVEDNEINIVGCAPINKEHFEDYDGKIHYKTDLTIPLLTEGQLISFLEGKTGDIFEIVLDYMCNYEIILGEEHFKTMEMDLLEALWKATNQIILKYD